MKREIVISLLKTVKQLPRLYLSSYVSHGLKFLLLNTLIHHYLEEVATAG